MSKLLLAGCGALLVGALAGPAAAQTARSEGWQKIDVSKLGPQVGERVPDFTLPDQTGKPRTLQSVMGPNGLMLVFYRSADW
jgi:cytochrome oxidase Cu insertion factor (SCO1/SenC/PrrC family)